MAAAFAIAVGIWWNANTIAHLFIHRPFFRRRAANAWFAALLTATLGIPQSLWRDRHLAHHRGVPYRFRMTREIAWQMAIVAALWIAIALVSPVFLAGAYFPGYIGGLAICWLHGYYEHAGGITSHYGWLYNAVCFNDGYHVEHHRHPSARWSRLPALRDPSARASVWPAPLRWLGLCRNPSRAVVRALDALERVVLRSRRLQQWVVGSHARAFGALFAVGPRPKDVAIVGGGLFPRSALVVRRLMPDARITIVDENAANLARARAFINDDRVVFVHARFTTPKSSTLKSSTLKSNLNSELCNLKCDLAVFPLAFDGDRRALYARPPAPTVVVHDWIWRRRGASRVVSPLLLKRVNVVTS